MFLATKQAAKMKGIKKKCYKCILQLKDEPVWVMWPVLAEYHAEGLLSKPGSYLQTIEFLR